AGGEVREQHLEAVGQPVELDSQLRASVDLRRQLRAVALGLVHLEYCALHTPLLGLATRRPRSWRRGSPCPPARQKTSSPPLQSRLARRWRSLPARRPPQFLLPRNRQSWRTTGQPQGTALRRPVVQPIRTWTQS